MSRKPVDLVRARAALATLDRVRREHPEAFRGWERPEDWIAALEEKEAMPKTSNVQIVVRLPDDLVQRLDAYTEARNAAEPGLHFTRSDAVRVLLSKVLEVGEDTAKTSKPKSAKQ